MKNQLCIAVCTAVVLTSCTTPSPQNNASSSSESASQPQSSSSSEKVIRETKNVSYSGIVRPLGISVYMEGTHRLSLENDRFILLESDAVDLNGYVDEHVEVLGSIRPTVESDAMIMRVESIALQETSTSAQSADTTPSAGNTQSSTAASTLGFSFSSLSSRTESASSTPSSATQVASQTSSTDATSGAQKKTPGPAFLARQEKMASESFTAENWTQEYCSEHIGFCIPVHRNWWFTSFGATSTHYWHVELNSEAFEDLYEGPVVIDLNGESLNALSIANGSIHTDGQTVTGYRSWTNGRHFAIHADVSLRNAVEYITNNLREGD
ncbi:hypothetical protein COU76_02335 [Candidatus Peregrinibacteria bacterium CG10_big_fil_rev_8_21_14_0_10_49_10]|nr:MAG: hypothetical protein COU76_02335 [Candidatus Peregrinibacteria bacterium CG10_big_fil_rev_8_21_14_0_10_49_10]